jgi:hypothetical protein
MMKISHIIGGFLTNNVYLIKIKFSIFVFSKYFTQQMKNFDMESVSFI